MGSHGIRERVRAELVREIKDVARRQLADHGAAGLSVRAVTRELGMASSAVYRYFPSRDALLTALIADAYQGLADRATQAESVVAREAHLERWTAVFHAVRAWALDSPHEYALIYGSPVPGYAAPQDTTVPASGVALLLAQIALDVADDAQRARWRAESSGLSAELRSDVEALMEALPSVAEADLVAAMARVPAAAVVHIIDAWTTLFGAVSFELFGHYRRVVESHAAYLDHLAIKTAAPLGIGPAVTGSGS